MEAPSTSRLSGEQVWTGEYNTRVCVFLSEDGMTVRNVNTALCVCVCVFEHFHEMKNINEKAGCGLRSRSRSGDGAIRPHAANGVQEQNDEADNDETVQTGLKNGLAPAFFAGTTTRRLLLFKTERNKDGLQRWRPPRREKVLQQTEDETWLRRAPPVRRCAGDFSAVLHKGS